MLRRSDDILHEWGRAAGVVAEESAAGSTEGLGLGVVACNNAGRRRPLDETKARVFGGWKCANSR